MNSPVLSIKNVSIKIGGKSILQNCSLDIKRGELKVLIGPSGAGKSTLLQCINCLIPPDSGQIWLEDQELDMHNKNKLCSFRAQVGMIFQDFNLFDHLTALDNVAIALCKVRKFSKDNAKQRALDELARVGLSKRTTLYPAQLSGGQKQRVAIARALAMDPKVILLDEPTSALDPELVGEVLAVIRDLDELARVGLSKRTTLYPAQLSGGQKQRVAIARALAMDPKVILLDEPTSALDPELVGEVLAVIRDLAKGGMTMLMATHQMDFARALANEILFMEQGVIIERGTPQNLLAPNANTRTQAFCTKLLDMDVAE